MVEVTETRGVVGGRVDEASRAGGVCKRRVGTGAITAGPIGAGATGRLRGMADLLVVLDGAVIGEIAASGTVLRFTYRTEASGQVALSLSMPPSRREHPDARIRSWIGGLMPHDAGVLQRWAARVGLSGAARPERLLATRIGWDCPGSVQFCRPENLAEMPDRPRARCPVDEAEIAEALRAAIADMRGAGREDRNGRQVGLAYSLAGAQPKIALGRQGEAWYEPNGAEPSTHILKPPPAGIGEQPANEHLCLETARRLGLDAAPSALVAIEDLLVAVIERYDRVRDAGLVHRLHQEDVAQALGRGSDTRGEALGGVSTVDIVELLRAHGRDSDVLAVVDRLALAWTLGLVDGHGKNTSLLLSVDQVALAPLYDIASMLPYSPGGEDVYLAMHVGDQPDIARIGRADWQQHARRLGLPSATVLERVERVATEAADAAARAAEAAPDVAGDFPERFARAAGNWRQRCLDALISAPQPRPQRPTTHPGLTCLA